MKKINIHSEATINGNGVHTNRHTKAVVCIDTGEVFTSAIDAAERIGVHHSSISAACLGKIKTCKGMHFCYLSSALENLDAVVSRLREASSMEEDARKWRMQEAEKEAARIAEEKRQSDIAKAKEKVERCEKICSRLYNQWQDAIGRRAKAYEEYEALTGDIYENEEVVA